MADDTDPVPDTSGPASLGEVIRSFTHGTADPDALWSALKSSRLPSVPVGQISKAAESTAGMRWCQRCGRPEPENAGCPNASFAPEPPAQAQVKAPAEPRRWQYPVGGMEFPSDPFPETDVLAGMGIAQMLAAMEAGGVDPLRAERIIGAMLAAHGMMAKEAGNDER